MRLKFDFYIKDAYVYLTVGILLGAGLTFLVLGLSKHNVGKKIVKDIVKVTKESNAKEILSDFENETDISKWSGNKAELSKVDKNCSQGTSCLEARFQKDGYFSAWQTLKKDWRGFKILRFDIYNPQEETVSLTFLIKDEVDPSYGGRYESRLSVRTGENHFDIDLSNLISNSKSRNIDISRIKEVVFSSKSEAALYFDNIYLEGNDEERPVKRTVNVGGSQLSAFEDNSDLSKWSGSNVDLSIADKYCSEKSHCLKAEFIERGYFSAWKTLDRDWSGYSLLSFDAYNSEEGLIPFTISIKDEIDSSYPGRYDSELALRPGNNHFDINLTGLMSNNKKRKIDVSRIKELVFASSKPATVYFDNIGLNNGGEHKEKVSALKGSPLIFNTFENKKDIVKWSGKDVMTSIVDEHCSEGKNCLKTIYQKGEYPGIKSKGIPGDWTGYGTFKFDAFNAQDKVVKFGLSIIDSYGDSYPQRYDGYFALKPGENSFEFNITGLKTNDKKRNISFDKIKEIVIFLIKPEQETTVYFDNMRLENDKVSSLKGLKAFDFGKEDSELWPGFTKITDKTIYSTDQGYGWDNLENMRAEDRQYPDPLLRDWVRAKGPFNIDLPNGKYLVYMMMEDPGFWEYYQNYLVREFYAEDILVGREFLSQDKFFKEYYLKNMDHEDLPGADIFNDYVEKRFVWRRFSVEVKDDQLNLQCKPNAGYACTLSALVIAPLEKEKESLDFMKALTEKRKKYFYSKYVEDIPKKEKISFELTDKDKARGYLLFMKNNSESVNPYTVPERSDIQKEINVIAAKSEKEHFAINIYPLKNLGECELTLSDLVSGNGSKLSSDYIRIRAVQYKLKLKGSNIYSVRGEMLRSKNKIQISEGITRQFWITIDVSKDIEPGKYSGKIIFRTKDGVYDETALNVTVFPFELSEPDIPIGLFYYDPVEFDWYKGMTPSKWTIIERQLKDLRKHNMNSLALGISPKITKVYENGDVDIDFEFYDEFLRAYKHFGFNKTISGYGLIKIFKEIRKLTEGDDIKFSKAIKNAYRMIEYHVKEFTGVDVLAGLADEVSNTGSEGIRSVLKVAGILKEEDAVKTTAFLNNPKDVQIFGHVDAVTINDGMKISNELLDKARNSGSDLWLYNIGQDRLTFGYYLWKTKAKGRMQWHYQIPAVDPYFDLDGRESDYCASYPSLEGPINTVWFENVSDGIDDYRYILTLKNLIDKAKDSSNQEILSLANEAQATIDAIMDSVNVELDKNSWPQERYNENKMKIAAQIIKLQKVLTQGEL